MLGRDGGGDGYGYGYDLRGSMEMFCDLDDEMKIYSKHGSRVSCTAHPITWLFSLMHVLINSTCHYVSILITAATKNSPH
jgi:hypothetical protein